MSAKIQKFLERIQRERKISFTTVSEENGNPCYIIRADVKVGDNIYQCDTHIELRIRPSDKAELVVFTTRLYEPLAGAQIEYLDKMIDALNCIFYGKVLKDYFETTPEEAYEILYLTFERHRFISYEIFAENLKEHAFVKHKLVNLFDYIKKEYTLRTKTSKTEAEDWVAKQMSAFVATNNSSNAKLKYLPPEAEKA